MHRNPLEKLSFPTLVCHPSPRVKSFLSPTTSMFKHEAAFSPNTALLISRLLPGDAAGPSGSICCCLVSTPQNISEGLVRPWSERSVPQEEV